jgi:hypothetical protein
LYDAVTLEPDDKLLAQCFNSGAERVADTSIEQATLTLIVSTSFIHECLSSGDDATKHHALQALKDLVIARRHHCDCRVLCSVSALLAEPHVCRKAAETLSVMIEHGAWCDIATVSEQLAASSPTSIRSETGEEAWEFPDVKTIVEYLQYACRGIVSMLIFRASVKALAFSEKHDINALSGVEHYMFAVGARGLKDVAKSMMEILNENDTEKFITKNNELMVRAASERQRKSQVLEARRIDQLRQERALMA